MTQVLGYIIARHDYVLELLGSNQSLISVQENAMDTS